jgi:putative nucleotidyltransferase with HDIG domain
MMKTTIKPFSGNLRDFLRRILNLTSFRPGPALASLVMCAVTVVMVIANMSGEDGRNADIQEFETGKVADRDVIAGHQVSYIDEEATRIRIEAQEQLVPAVFRFSAGVESDTMESWNVFCDYTGRLAQDRSSAHAARLAIQAQYPSWFSDETITAYYGAKERDAYRDFGAAMLDTMLKRGVFAVDRSELARYNPDVLELTRSSAVASEQERLFYSAIVTGGEVREALGAMVKDAGMPAAFTAIAVDLLSPFVKENVFFSPEDSSRRVEEARERVAPVTKSIDKGKRIIRKGFIITDEEMRELRALHNSAPGRDPRNVIGMALMVIAVYALFVFLRSRIFLGRELSDSESYLLSTLIGLYLVGSVLIKTVSFTFETFPVSLAFPTALIVMIPAVFMGTRLALVMAMALPLGAYLAGSFDASAYIFALVSGITASTVLKDAEKRMDLIKAGLIIAGANCLAVVLILLIRRAGPGEYPVMLFWAALNGIISGMLVLGCLPPLEHALNAVTPFRLLELSDLNAPILRKLFTAAPGTYSHSIMVANLSEQACQDIGANALLARVGAYYHDIGKMENPEYFVENQTDHNKHDDINPRLSATVIRSHVKLGIEKARSLGLPKAVIAFIAEHHGDSLISWFYNKAAQQEDQVTPEDFAYPGNPPRSRESAVVMLADVTEAACRTLSKPTAAKLEKFIQGLFDSKVEHGQLAECDLTFRDMETIKKAFVRVLAGYYHSRIEYPGQKEDE